MGVNPKCRVQEKVRKPQSCICIVGFSVCGCQKKRVVYEMECRYVAVPRGKQDLNHTSDFVLNTF